jgi:hypothetical protein
MGGSAVAAKHYLISSTKQISPKVLNKLKGNAGRPGAAGAIGATGSPGLTGPRGPTGSAGPGTVTGVTAGTGLTGRGSTGNVTLGADFNAVQARVTGSPCVGGISSIAVNGAASCATTAVSPLVAELKANEEEITGLTSLNPGPVGVNLILKCHASGATEVEIVNEAEEAGATVNWTYSDGTTTHASGVSLGLGHVAKFGFGASRIEGQFIVLATKGVATLALHAFDGGSFCEFVGTTTSAAT